MPKKKRSHRKKPKRRQPKTPTFTKAATDLTKLAVTGLVGAGLISTTGAAIKDLTKK